MKNKAVHLLFCSTIGLLQCQGQGSFRNLDFESANVFGGSGSVSAGDAFPGWQVYWGEQLGHVAVHNTSTAGSVAALIFGPSYNGCCIIEGNLTAGLQPGILGSQSVDASLAQVGQVPSSSLSLQFKVVPGSEDNLVVRLAGENLGLVRLQTTTNYSLYGANISKFAGQSVELRFTALLTPQIGFNPVFFDSIRFSSNPVPEPDAWALFGLGSALLCCAARRRRKSSALQATKFCPEAEVKRSNSLSPNSHQQVSRQRAAGREFLGKSIAQRCLRAKQQSVRKVHGYAPLTSIHAH